MTTIPGYPIAHGQLPRRRPVHPLNRLFERLACLRKVRRRRNDMERMPYALRKDIGFRTADPCDR